MSKDWFYNDLTSCKIGTIPALVLIHKSDKVQIGSYVRVKECEGDKWHRLLITNINEDGYIFFTRN